MIINRRTGIIHLIRNSVPIILTLVAWDVVVVLVYQFAHQPWMDQPALPYSLIGSALVLFLNMRNNAAYNRWWEARTLWGAVVNNTRSFSRQADTLLGGAPELTRAMAAYAYSLGNSMRGEREEEDTARLIPSAWDKISTFRNRPTAILQHIGHGVRAIVAERHVHPVLQSEIDRILSDLSNAQGGLERIRNTPLAIQFSVMPRLLVRFFCLVLPLSMVQELGWITPFGSTLVGFLFLALDEIGLDLENPFENNEHAVPMLAMARTIEIDLLQSIGDPAPAPVTAEKGILP